MRTLHRIILNYDLEVIIIMNYKLTLVIIIMNSELLRTSTQGLVQIDNRLKLCKLLLNL